MLHRAFLLVDYVISLASCFTLSCMFCSSILFCSVLDSPRDSCLFKGVLKFIQLQRFEQILLSKALEIYFQYQWNPLAHNYITTVKKKPLLSRLVVLILSNHVVIRSLSSQVLYLSLVFSNPFVVVLINMLVRLMTAFSFSDVSGVKPVLCTSQF